MDDLAVALEAAQRAAALVDHHMGEAVTADWKGAVDPVTEIDRRAEDAIVAFLRRHRPDDAILGEESGATGSTARRWIVDPLDGTVNFLHAVPHVSVSVALWDDNEPIVGVIVDPTRDEVFAATAGAGASLNGRPLRVSDTRDPAEALVAVGFPYDRQERASQLGAAVGRLLGSTRGLRRMGSAALDLAYVAAGRYDAYWEPHIEPWDGAAGYLLVVEAGGAVTRPDGDPYAPAPGGILASNGLLHAVIAGLTVG